MMSLVPSRKRKDTHNALQQSREKGKVRVIERSAALLSSMTSGSSRNPHPRSSTPVGRTFSNLRRGNIRLFSIFRNDKTSIPSSGEARSTSIGLVGNKPKGTPLLDVAKSDSITSLHCSIVLDEPTSLPTPNLDSDDTLFLQLTNPAVFDGESEPLLSTRTPPPTPITTSWSSPTLSQQLTAKLSNALVNNETVVHRPKLRSRPTVETNFFKQPSPATSPKTPMSEVPSLPSSVLSPGSSFSPLSQSTAPTSLVSSGGPRSAETIHRAYITDTSPSLSREPTAEHIPSRFLVFPRQDAPRLCEPSIVTIETAAAAKIFFESHFNQLFSTRVTPRSMRRRQMERKLFTMAIANEQRHCKRRE
ncbi:serine threonine- kinase cbk1 [Pyrenophora seminiperda CCB06]|uniref:Serine threonine-kinase cbk1 n=1 Tax=Pyrenophora seminiperda CCB06 TaxID=1302712 RepID=A0A3M7LVX2_9PLEO|nr:serine threonine- kinase cbk1 [Pyrenophora seminiperda CCB06]